MGARTNGGAGAHQRGPRRLRRSGARAGAAGPYSLPNELLANHERRRWVRRTLSGLIRQWPLTAALLET